MAVDIKGPSGNVAEVNTDNEILATLTKNVDKAGFAKTVAEVDDGSIFGALGGAPTNRVLDVSEDYVLRVTPDNLVAFENFVGTALNTNNWKNPTGGGGTNSVSNGILTLNSAGSLVSGAYSIVQSWRNFVFTPSTTLYAQCSLRVNNGAMANKVFEYGFGIVSDTTAITDGCGIRYGSDGTLRVFTARGGVETTSPDIITALPLDTNVHKLLLEITGTYFAVWADDVLLYRLESTSVSGAVVSGSLPLFFRWYNSGATSSVFSTEISGIVLSQCGLPSFKRDSAIKSAFGGNSIQGQTSFATLTSTANITNNTAPTSASLSNTVPSYSTLGGFFLYSAIAATETDYALFGYQVPAPSSTLTGKQLGIYRIRIDITNLGAAIATTPTVINWQLGVGSTGASLVTTDSATTKAPRRINLGTTSWLVGEAIGSTKFLDLNFEVPYFVNPSEYLHLILRIISGTGTASQTFRGAVMFNGVFD